MLDLQRFRSRNHLGLADDQQLQHGKQEATQAGSDNGVDNMEKLPSLPLFYLLLQEQVSAHLTPVLGVVHIMPCSLNLGFQSLMKMDSSGAGPWESSQGLEWEMAQGMVATERRCLTRGVTGNSRSKPAIDSSRR